jgi:hypothetical protein
MKVRKGFVSNSSSTSFVIYGVSLPEGKEDDYYDLLSDDPVGLNIFYPEYDGIYIGKSWSSIKDDETGLQFKQSVENRLKELLGNQDVKCSTYEEGYYNG